jgi:hypothetical protein
MEAVRSKEYKMIDGRTIKFTILEFEVLSTCGPFNAKYKRTDVNHMLEMHDKILTANQLKDVRKFINEATEPPQLSLF